MSQAVHESTYERRVYFDGDEGTSRDPEQQSGSLIEKELTDINHHMVSYRSVRAPASVSPKDSVCRSCVNIPNVITNKLMYLE